MGFSQQWQQLGKSTQDSIKARLAISDSSKLLQKSDTSQLLAKRDTDKLADGIRATISQKNCVYGTVSLGVVSPSTEGSASFSYGKTITNPSVIATLETLTGLGSLSGHLSYYINNKNTTSVVITVWNATGLTIPLTANVHVCQSD